MEGDAADLEQRPASSGRSEPGCHSWMLCPSTKPHQERCWLAAGLGL